MSKYIVATEHGYMKKISTDKRIPDYHYGGIVLTEDIKRARLFSDKKKALKYAHLFKPSWVISEKGTVLHHFTKLTKHQARILEKKGVLPIYDSPFPPTNENDIKFV